MPTGIPDTMRSGPGVLTITNPMPNEISSSEDAGGQTCHINFSVNGSSATVMPNQTCTLSTGLLLTYTMGMETLGSDNKTLSGTVYYNFSGPVSYGSGTPFMASGGGSNVSTCTKM
jgi:hypothetical protein